MGHRVLRAITRLNIGGPAIQALMLTRELKDDYPTLLAAGAAPPDEGELSEPEVEVTRVPLKRRLSPPRDVRAALVLRRLMLEDRTELLHTHMAKAGATGRVAAFSLRVPPVTVHTFHGHVFEGYFTPRWEKVFIRIERILAARTDALVAVSAEIRDALLGYGIGRPDQWRVIPLGFDLSSFLNIDAPFGDLRREVGVPDSVPLIGIAGRLTLIKDHATLFDAVRRLPGVHLAVLGDGELRGNLQLRAEQVGIMDRVHFLGWRSDMASCLADLDVVALTSRNEGTPVSLIEALAAGRPVVSTDVGGVRSVVDHEESGLLVPSGDAEGVATALRRLIDDVGLRRAMGATGRKRVAAAFGKERLVSNIKDLYAELLTRRAAG